jgi:hypothetical protein
MRVPQAKQAPSQALRAMFAGIGQFLSITDRLRGKSPASPDPETDVPPAAPRSAAPETATPETATPETAAPEIAAPEAAAPQTAGGHVRLVQRDEAPAAVAEPAPAPAAVAEPAPAPSPAPVPAPAPAAVAEPALTPGAELPLANYDELTIASLRARLRNLSADQLGQLIEYEKSHADRTEVITMFERRVAKLAAG